MGKSIASRLARAVLWLMWVGLALAAGLNAAANVWRSTRPDLALRLRPGDAMALSRRADLDADRAGGMIGNPASVAETARWALRSEPLTAPAIRQLALAEAGEGRIDGALTLMRLSHQVTRHDLPTLLWSIYGSAMSGEVEAALQYADEAMSVGENLGEELFPRLTAALVNPAMREAIIPYWKRDRSWMPGFLYYAMTSGAAAEQVAILSMAAGGFPHTWRYEHFDALLLNQLAATGDFAVARTYLRRMIGERADFVTDAGFTPLTINPDYGSFAWSFTGQFDIGAELDDAGRLQVHVATDRHGPVAARTILLKPGHYDFVEKVSFPAAVGRATATWELRCVPAGREGAIWMQDVPVLSAEATYSSAVEIPERCAGQQLILLAGDNDDQGEAQIVIDRLSFVRRRP